MALISTENLPQTVYGIQQVSYTVDGVKGKDYAAAVAAATFVQATAFEAECSAIAAMTRQRMKKLDDLGWALAVIAEVRVTFPTKNPTSGDKGYNSGLERLSSILATYGFKSYVTKTDGGYYITRGNADYVENDIKFEMDREDNDLQQDLVTLQGMFSKRDNAFSTAQNLVSKTLNAAQSIIGNFGG